VAQGRIEARKRRTAGGGHREKPAFIVNSGKKSSVGGPSVKGRRSSLEGGRRAGDLEREEGELTGERGVKDSSMRNRTDVCEPWLFHDRRTPGILACRERGKARERGAGSNGDFWV